LEREKNFEPTSATLHINKGNYESNLQLTNKKKKRQQIFQTSFKAGPKMEQRGKRRRAYFTTPNNNSRFGSGEQLVVF